MGATIPSLTYWQVFLRFLRFGALAWGGPVAQISMIRRELVDEEGWIDSARFHRVLAVYQALPGPEAHELCVYFGILARGRVGGILAGLGFMLPGFTLMLGLAWLYTAQGLGPTTSAAFLGLQAAAVALLTRGAIDIGRRVLVDRGTWSIALVAASATAIGLGFIVVLCGAGSMRLLAARRMVIAAGALGVAILLVAGIMAYGGHAEDAGLPAVGQLITEPSVATLLASGLKAGLFTFGGAYTAISVLYQEAVVVSPWMTAQQFFDGVALGGILPAPLVIFGTFAGFIGGGLPGAFALTAGIFLPAFAITLLGHTTLERLVDRRETHDALDGVMAGVVGLIAVTALVAARQVLVDPSSVAIFGAALLAFVTWRARYGVVVIMLAAGPAGVLLFGR